MTTVHSWKSLENPPVLSWLEHGTCSDPLLQPCRARQAHPLDASPVLGDNWDTVVAEQVPQIPVPVPWAPGHQAGTATEPQVGDGQINPLWLSCKRQALDGPEK